MGQKKEEHLTLIWVNKKRISHDILFISCAIGLQIVSLALSCHKYSKYVFGFEIGPREVGQKIRRTSVTDRHTDKPLTILYRLHNCEYKF